MKHWLLQMLIAIDQFFNATLGGWADETLSSRAWRVERNGHFWGRILRPLIDGIFLSQTHCAGSYEDERKNRQLPPEFRD